MSAQPQEVCSRGHEMSSNRKRHPNGDTYCASCKTMRQVQYRKDYPERSKKYYKHTNLRRLYGLEPEAYDQLLVKQDNRCAVCHARPYGRALHVDHDHETGKVRGLLCHGCNTALGLLGEDRERILQLLEYIGRRCVEYAA